METRNDFTVPLSSGSGKSPATISDAVKDRAARRAAKAEQRRARSDQLKEEGNTLYRSGDYLGAARCYEQANAVHGSVAKPILLANLAAAYLKLGLFSEAEVTALDALIADPKSVKARFRRGVAREEMNMPYAAAVDFRTVLRLDPGNKEARSRLDAVEALCPFDDHEALQSDYEFPYPDDEPWLAESLSDSSDCGHWGIGIPYKFYNHDGCAKGRECRYSHAPDNKSLRDALGKNVCLYYLMGICKFGDAKCVYSHSKEHLPETGWCKSPAEVAKVKEMLKLKKLLDKEATVLDVLSSLRFTGPSKKRKAKGRKKPRRRGQRGSRYLGLSEDVNEFGFTDGEMEELLCQGVKPWDDDAHDVLAALYSGYQSPYNLHNIPMT